MSSTLIIVLAYLVIMFGIAWYVSRKESLEGYFVNARKTLLWMMTLSNVATVVGAGATVAIIAEVYNSGISYGLALPVALAIGMLVLGLLAKKIKSIGDAYNARTVADFFEHRFDRKNKILVAVLQIFMLIIWIGIQAIAMASLATVLVGIEYNVALIGTALMTICYTALGGLKADIITDVVQFWMIIIFFVVMVVIGYGQVGGVATLLSSMPASHLDPFAFGGIGWSVGAIIFGGFLFLGNTTYWQRIFAAENESVAKRSFLWAIPITLVLGVAILFLGLVAKNILPPDMQKETALFSLMKSLLPTWLVGLGYASILAVVMSSVDSFLVGGSAILHKQLFAGKNLGAKKELLYARLTTAVFGAIGFVVAFMFPNIVTLTLIVSYLAMVFVPPIFAGLFSKKISADASFWSLVIPTIILFALYPVVGVNIFLLTIPAGVLIVLLYDKVFRVKS